MTGDPQGLPPQPLPGDNTAVGPGGSFTQADLADLRRRFSALPAGQPPAGEPAKYTRFRGHPKPIEQKNPHPGLPGAGLQLPGGLSLQLLSILGRVSSRLFQQVRSSRGCATPSTLRAGHVTPGVFCIYTALNRDTEAKALATIRQVVDQPGTRAPPLKSWERA